jgi:protein-L-isoaspartate O-methyltransferase
MIADVTGPMDETLQVAAYRNQLNAVFASVDPYRFTNRPTTSISSAWSGPIQTFRRADGLVLSAISDRNFLKDVLVKLGPLSGRRIFEIGTGSGYLAAILAELCGQKGEVVGCEIIDDLYKSSGEAIRELGLRNVTLHGGDFIEILPKQGVFDVILCTSSFSYLHPAITGACSPNGGLIAIPIEIPGGGDCMTIYQFAGKRLEVKAAFLSISVPTTGPYSGRAIWARQIREVVPDWDTRSVTTLSDAVTMGSTVRDSLGFRSHLLFADDRFRAFNLGPGPHLLRQGDMAFGYTSANFESFGLFNAGRLLLSGPDSLHLTSLFTDIFSRWAAAGRVTLAESRYAIDMANSTRHGFRFEAGFGTALCSEEIQRC